MKQKIQNIETVRLLVSVLFCEMLSMCTSEERCEIFNGLEKVTRRQSVSAIFQALFRGGETEEGNVWTSQISAALSLPACMVVKNLLTSRE